MGTPRRPYEPEFRAEAVRLVESSERSIRDVAKDLGISRTPLREAMLGLEAQGFIAPQTGQTGGAVSEYHLHITGSIKHRFKRIALTLTHGGSDIRPAQRQGAGYKVQREFYVNDAGVQMDTLIIDRLRPTARASMLVATESITMVMPLVGSLASASVCSVLNADRSIP